MKSRYFKISGDGEDTSYSIWELKRVRERCLYSTDALNNHTHWHSPEAIGEQTILFFLENGLSTELTEEDAFLEML